MKVLSQSARHHTVKSTEEVPKRTAKRRLEKKPAARQVIFRLPGKLVAALDGSARANLRSRNAEAVVLLTKVLGASTSGA